MLWYILSALFSLIGIGLILYSIFISYKDFKKAEMYSFIGVISLVTSMICASPK